MARVSHPNVLTVYEVGQVDQGGHVAQLGYADPRGHAEQRGHAEHPGQGDPETKSGTQVFIAMEFIEGSTLHVWQQQAGRTWDEILRMYMAAGQGLHAAHSAGLVHRDFKPDSVRSGRDRPLSIRSTARGWKIPSAARCPLVRIG
jgi:serine/threonine-protein kinase